ncbi:MAG: TlpA family protein disulfide reductase [Saprospiraceae bacterium]|nr:TlpA family protein disulfide reductase [Saprospiraceae bacterium]MBK9721657.1 TlpA family protein disulfide reductase [Saprospiraceae bacterium]
MSHKILLLVLFFNQNIYGHLNAQQSIPVVNTKELLSLINSQDDTLRIFNFWATWCKPCVQELPFFEELNTKRKEGKFVLYLVSLDSKESIQKKLVPFIKKRQLHSTIIVFDGGNPNVWIDQIEPNWTGSIPASLFTYKGNRLFAESSFENLTSIENFINQFKL